MGSNSFNWNWLFWLSRILQNKATDSNVISSQFSLWFLITYSIGHAAPFVDATIQAIQFSSILCIIWLLWEDHIPKLVMDDMPACPFCKQFFSQNGLANHAVQHRNSHCQAGTYHLTHSIHGRRFSHSGLCWRVQWRGSCQSTLTTSWIHLPIHPMPFLSCPTTWHALWNKGNSLSTELSFAYTGMWRNRCQFQCQSTLTTRWIHFPIHPMPFLSCPTT